MHPTPGDVAIIQRALTEAYLDERLIAKADAELFVSRTLFATVVAQVRKRLVSRPSTLFAGDLSRFAAFVRQAAAAFERREDAAGRRAFFEQALFPLLAAVTKHGFQEQADGLRMMRKCADLRAPHTWYPLARSLRRRIIYHAGPTNSGKTYNALQALKNAHSGIYCGPLRLLALEVFESLNGDGVHASLATGQERREMPFARHVSCTVEMLSVRDRVDVAVIDEIQMLGDEHRGAAWTRALLGVAAAEVHVCGDPAALPAVRAIAELCGDTLEVQEYARMTALSPSPVSLGADYSSVQEGDAVVAFSRRDVYAIRRVIERKTRHRCCVVYGTLPPETRSQQARLFNDPASGFRVLVATDAIGMGLNLNIRRVVFHSMEKFDGREMGPVPPPHVKQIAGRAGRRSSIYPQGFATTLQDADLAYLHECLAATSPAIPAAGLFPNAEQLIAFAALLPADTPFATLVMRFLQASVVDGPYFMCRDDAIKDIAALLQPYPLTLQQRCTLALAPVNLRNRDVRAYFSSFLAEYCGGGEVRLALQLPLSDAAYLQRDLEALEVKVQVLDVYVWMAQRLGPYGFPDLQRAVALRETASELLEAALQAMSSETKEDWERELARKQAAKARWARSSSGSSGGSSAAGARSPSGRPGEQPRPRGEWQRWGPPREASLEAPAGVGSAAVSAGRSALPEASVPPPRASFDSDRGAFRAHRVGSAGAGSGGDDDRRYARGSGATPESGRYQGNDSYRSQRHARVPRRAPDAAGGSSSSSGSGGGGFRSALPAVPPTGRSLPPRGMRGSGDGGTRAAAGPRALMPPPSVAAAPPIQAAPLA